MTVSEGLTREENIAKATELRERGLTYREIGERLGVTPACVYKWLRPEWTKQQNAKENAKPKRKAAKRQWEKAARATCPRCGGLFGQGSRCPSKRSKLCIYCVRDNRRAKIVRCIELRREGLTNREIALREDLAYNSVANLLCEAAKEGFEVPPPPYWSRAKSAGSVASRP